MKGAVAIAMISMMGWCDSLGDGCAPMIPGGDDGASGGGSTAAGSTDWGATQASSGAAPTGDSTGAAAGTSQGADDTTLAAADTSGAEATTTTDSTGASSGTASTGAESTGAPPTCGDGEVEAPEECDTDPDGDHGVLECDADCRAIRAVDLAAGAAHACVLLSDGRVRCWGDNSHGQRGAMNELEDVRLGADTPLIAGEGASDLGKDVRIDTGNGRVFAGGATTCVTTALAQQTWCWGLGFGGEQPQSTIGEYSAIAMGDVVDPVTKDWWLCGLEWKDPKHVLRCWGSLDDLNTTLFERLGDVDTCFNAVDEVLAGTRLVELAGAVPGLDLGRSLGCAPTGAAMLCAGNDGKICDGEPLSNPCVGTSFKPCPSLCNTKDCNKSAAAVGLWDNKMCYVHGENPSLVNCYAPAPAAPTNLAMMCAPGFAARQLAVAQDFWCAVDPDRPAGDQVCCSDIDGDGVMGGLVSFTAPTAGIVKIVAQVDGVLLLDQLGRVIRVAPGAETWESQQAL